MAAINVVLVLVAAASLLHTATAQFRSVLPSVRSLAPDADRTALDLIGQYAIEQWPDSIDAV